MTREILIDHILNRYGVSPEYPWEGDALSAVFRHGDNRKWFALIMNIAPEKVGRAQGAPIDVVNLKCEPEMIGSMRLLPGVLPAYHMNKDHWITVLLEEGPGDDTLFDLLDVSYVLTAAGKKSAPGKRSKNTKNLL